MPVRPLDKQRHELVVRGEREVLEGGRVVVRNVGDRQRNIPPEAALSCAGKVDSGTLGTPVARGGEQLVHVGQRLPLEEVRFHTGCAGRDVEVADVWSGGVDVSAGWEVEGAAGLIEGEAGGYGVMGGTKGLGGGNMMGWGSGGGVCRPVRGGDDRSQLG